MSSPHFKHIRRNKGTMLLLVIALLLMIAAVEIAFYIYSHIAVGTNDLRAATDALAVASAEQALRVSVPFITDGTEDSIDEEQVFASCADSNTDGSNQISLLSYNRIVGRAIEIAMNAEETAQYGDGANSDGRTQSVRAKTQNIFKAAQDIGHRLREKMLNKNNYAAGMAWNKANPALSAKLSNGLVIDSVDLGYMFPSRASNLIIPNHLQAAIDNDLTMATSGHLQSCTINTVKGNGLLNGDDHFLSGYQDNWINQVTHVTGETDSSRDSVIGIPMATVPHVINNSEFDTNKTAQLTIPDMKKWAVPNAIKVTVHINEPLTGRQTTPLSAAAVAGSGNQTYAMSMPDAYLVLYVGDGGAQRSNLLNYFDTCEFGTYVRQFVFPNNAGGGGVDPINPHNGETSGRANVRTETMYVSKTPAKARSVFESTLNWIQDPANFNACHVKAEAASQDVYGKSNAGPAPENRATPGQEFQAFISDRLQQMNPDHGAQDAVELLTWQPPQQKAFYIIYYDASGNLNKWQAPTGVGGPEFSKAPIPFYGSADGMLREYFNAVYSDGFQAGSGANRCLGAVSVNCRAYGAQIKDALDILAGSYTAARVLIHGKDY